MIKGTFLLFSRLLHRLPDRKQFLPVLSTVVFIVFTWTIYHALFEVPGWLFYMTLPGIMLLFAYILSFALLESLLVSAFIVAYCLFLPVGWLKKYFAAEGFLLAILLALVAYLMRNEFEKIQKLASWQLAAIPLVFFLMIAMVAPLIAKFLTHFPKLVDWLENIGNRLTIFSYIYVPLGILGWLVVFVRNLI
jgi:hypothetical protein